MPMPYGSRSTSLRMRGDMSKAAHEHSNYACHFSGSKAGPLFPVCRLEWQRDWAGPTAEPTMPSGTTSRTLRAYGSASSSVPMGATARRPRNSRVLGFRCRFSSTIKPECEPPPPFHTLLERPTNVTSCVCLRLRLQPTLKAGAKIRPLNKCFRRGRRKLIVDSRSRVHLTDGREG